MSKLILGISMSQSACCLQLLLFYLSIERECWTWFRMFFHLPKPNLTGWLKMKLSIVDVTHEYYMKRVIRISHININDVVIQFWRNHLCMRSKIKLPTRFKYKDGKLGSLIYNKLLGRNAVLNGFTILEIKVDLFHFCILFLLFARR